MGNLASSMLKKGIDKIFGDKINGGATSSGQSSTPSGTSGTTGPTYGEMLNGGNASGGSSNVGTPTYGEVLNGPNPSYGTSISEPLGSLASASADGLDTFGQFTQNAQLGYHDIHMGNVDFYDNQAEETINAINEQKTADDTYSQNVYDTEMESHTNIKNEGTKLAEGQKDLAFQYGESERDIRYTAAEEARAESDRIADIDRERSMVDAHTSYAQNLATYGANAERLGRMGLSGSGYSDYLNAQAYATQRGEVQAAAARSEKAKREALYAEKQAKLDADSAFNQVKYNAESTYLTDMHDVNTTYEKNVTTSALDKLGRDHESDTTARQNTHNAKQTAAEGIHESEITYLENIIGTEKDLANHRVNEENRAEDKAAAEETERNSAYLEILSNPGAYSAEDIDALAAEYGFSGEQISSLKSAVERANTKAVEEEEEVLKSTFAQNYQTVSTNIKTDPDFYSDAELDKMVTDKLLSSDDAEAAKQLKKDITAQYAREDIEEYISSGDTDAACKLADKQYNNGSGWMEKEEYQKIYLDSWMKDIGSETITPSNIDSYMDLVMRDMGASKLSGSGAGVIQKTLWEKIGTTQKVSAINGNFTMNGEKYYCAKNIEDTKLIGILNGISTYNRDSSPSEGTIVNYGKKTYVYVKYYLYGKEITGWAEAKKSKR